MHLSARDGGISLDPEYARRIIHRPSHQPRERQYRLVRRWVAFTEGIVLIPPGRLASHPVRETALKARRPHRLMRIQHDMMFRGLLRHPHIMIHHPLSVMMLAPRNDLADITRLHGGVTKAVHQPEGSVHLPFIIGDRARG